MKTLVLIIFLVASARAQVASATLSGRVMDQSGAVIGGATITAAQPATGFSRATTTDPHGNYSFDQLAPGAYTITARKPGFRDYEAAGLTVELNQNARHEILLSLGGEQERITVAAAVSPVNTDNAAVGYR